MPVSREDVEHMAKLARLGLTEDEKAGLREDLEAILGYFEQLAAVDTAEVEPTARMIDTPAPVRIDRVLNEDAADLLVSGAPDRDGTHIRVPKILE